MGLARGPVPPREHRGIGLFFFFYAGGMVFVLAGGIIMGTANSLPVNVLALLMIALFGAMGLSSMRRYRRELRKQNNQCITCGYTLTGNLSGVCPECGTKIQQKNST